MADILRLIDTPKVGESAEGCCTIWLCVDCMSVYHEEVIELCAQCGKQVYPYVQGDKYSALAKQFLNMVAERDCYRNALLKCAAESLLS